MKLENNGKLWSRSSIRILISILSIFFFLQSYLKLGTTIVLGADEGFELAKATLCLHGYHLYADVWNDQPPLLTFLVTGILKHISLSAIWPRLLTGLFSAILLFSLFFMALRTNVLRVAALAALLVIASPGFLILGSTCMLEVPALATAIAALAALQSQLRSPWKELLAGVIFGVSFEIKLINFILLPLAAAILYWQQPKSSLRSVTKSLLILGAALVVTTVVTDYIASGGAYLSHFGTALASHFGTVKSTAHGSPSDHPFDWLALINSWDLTIPALFGVFVCLRSRHDPLSLLPVAWLALEFVVFGIHQPWWHYYIIHTSLPLCWCAAIGWVAAFRFAIAQRRRLILAGMALLSVVAGIWMSARLYLEIAETRHSPQTYTSLFLQEIARRKPDTKWFYSEEPIYSFYAQIPTPPDLAVVMLKRFWSGEISDEKIAAELAEYKPGLILIRNNSIQRPYHALLDSEYQLVYMDNDHLLYALIDRSKAPKRLHGLERLPGH